MRQVDRQGQIMTIGQSILTCLGFTLIELLVTIAILSIIATMGGVYFVPQLRQLEASNAANEVKTLLILSQQDALIYRNVVTLCVADESQKCVPSGGKILLSFIDTNGNHQYDATVDKLNEQRKLSLRFGELVTDVASGRNYVNFQPSNGRPVGYMGSIKYCPNDDKNNYKIRVKYS